MSVWRYLLGMSGRSGAGRVERHLNSVPTTSSTGSPTGSSSAPSSGSSSSTRSSGSTKTKRSSRPAPNFPLPNVSGLLSGLVGSTTDTYVTMIVPDETRTRYLVGWRVAFVHQVGDQTVVTLTRSSLSSNPPSDTSSPKESFTDLESTLLPSKKATDSDTEKSQSDTVGTSSSGPWMPVRLVGPNREFVTGCHHAPDEPHHYSCHLAE